MEFVKSHDVYNGRRVLVKEASYLDKNGNIKVMEHVNVSPAVAILALTKNNNIVFIKEKRTAIGNVELIEIPAGVIEKGEDPKEAAIRELREETGYVAKDIRFLTSYYSSCGFTNEKIFIYLAVGVEEKLEQDLDDEEEISVFEVPKKDALKMLKKGTFDNCSTQMALLWLNNLKEDISDEKE